MNMYYNNRIKMKKNIDSSFSSYITFILLHFVKRVKYLSVSNYLCLT
jgi:hypothetical protein